MQYGHRVLGRMVQIPPFTAADTNSVNASSKPGGIYQIDLHTDGVVDPQSAINVIVANFEAFHPDLKVLSVEASEKSKIITVQIVDTGPNDFSFIGLLGATPAILALVFVVVIGYVLWTVYTNNPIWLWAILALGGAVAFYYLVGGTMRGPTTGGAIRTPSSPTYSTGARESRDTNIRRAVDSYEKQIQSHEDALTKYQDQQQMLINKSTGTPGDQNRLNAVAILINKEQKKIEELEKKRDETIDKLAKS